MSANSNHNAAQEAWRTAVGKVLKGASPETLTALTRDAIAIEPLYPPADVAGPGPWRAAARSVGTLQRVDHPDPHEAGALARLDLDNGANGVVLVGTGSPTARGFGLAPGDLGEALHGLPLWSGTVRLEFAPDQLSAAVEVLLTQADRDGFAPDSLRLDVGIDPLASAETLRPQVERLRGRGIAGALLRADGRPHHDAGASEAQELAAVLAAGVAALRALEPLGLEVARDALGFTLAVDADLLVGVAKLRALRRLWAQVEEGCGLAPQPMRLHAETAWRMMARRDAHTNILRTTIATAAAILGGADSVTVLPFTGALGLPDAFARRLARNTALVLLQESNLARVVDPAAGAGAFETITDALAEKAWAVFQDLERQGGLAVAMASGTWPRAVAAMREKRRAEIADGRAALVGVTRFVPAADVAPTVLMPAPDASDGPATALPSGRDAEPFENL